MSVTENVLELPAHVSHSQVSTWSKCGRQYLLERVMRVETQPQGALLGGSAVHEAIEVAMREGMSSTDAQLKFISVFSESVKDSGGPEAVRWGGRKSKASPGGEDESWWLVQGPLMVGRAMLLLESDKLIGNEVVSFEADYAFDVEGKRVVAKPDVVVIHPEGTVTIRDWKTGATISPQNPIQLAIYTIAVCEAHGYDQANVVGQVVNLRKDGAEGLINYDPKPYIDLARTLIRDFVAGSEAGVFPMSPSPMCVACGVKAHCDYGRTLSNEGGDEA